MGRKKKQTPKKPHKHRRKDQRDRLKFQHTSDMPALVLIMPHWAWLEEKPDKYFYLLPDEFRFTKICAFKLKAQNNEQALVFITLYFKRHTKQSLFSPRERNKVSRTKLYPKKHQHSLCFSRSKPLSTFYTAVIVTSGTVWWQLLQPAQSAACRLLCICEKETFWGMSGRQSDLRCIIFATMLSS